MDIINEIILRKGLTLFKEIDENEIWFTYPIECEILSEELNKLGVENEYNEYFVTLKITN